MPSSSQHHLLSAALLTLTLFGSGCEGERRVIRPGGDSADADGDAGVDAAVSKPMPGELDAGDVQPPAMSFDGDAGTRPPTADVDAGLPWLDAGTDPGLDGGQASDGAAPIPADGYCFEAKTVTTASQGDGSCAQPLTLDLSGAAVDDTFLVVTPAGGADQPIPALGKCGEGLARDMVFVVTVPNETDLEVTVTADGDADPILLVQDGPAADCEKATTIACLDETGAGQCEYARLRWGSDAFAGGATQLIVSEAQGSGEPLTLHLRLRDPGSGS